MKKLSIFEKITVVNKLLKVIDCVKEAYDNNDSAVDDLKVWLDEVITVFRKLPNILPGVKKLVEDIYNVLFKK